MSPAKNYPKKVKLVLAIRRDIMADVISNLLYIYILLIILHNSNIVIIIGILPVILLYLIIISCYQYSMCI